MGDQLGAELATSKQICGLVLLVVSAASMNIDGNAAKWLHANKLTHAGLGSWEQFTAAIGEKFGTYDYRKAMTTLSWG